MPSIEDEIRQIEEEIKKTQYNKATEHHIGRLKAKMAKLEKTKEERAGRGGGTGFFIKKGAYPSIALVGPPSVGKSSILNSITDAESKIGSFDFTTLSIVPGIMEYEGMKFRILDLPGIIEGAHEGKGRGREVISVLRGVELILIILDPYKYEPGYIVYELGRAGIRVNQKPPRMSVTVKDRGGINILTVGGIKVDEELFQSIAREFGIVNADIVIGQAMSPERFIDGLLGNRAYIPAVFVLNKSDLPEFRDAYEYLVAGGYDPLPVSTSSGENILQLKRKIAEKMTMMRVFLDSHRGTGDGEPMIMREGSTVEDVCRLLHTDFVEKFKFATIVGPSVKYPNQRVGLDHAIKDGDRLSIFLKKG
jgi:ribosome-interacting GTPase 1